MDEVEIIAEALEKRIKVFIIWDDCYDIDSSEILLETNAFSFSSYRKVIENHCYNGVKKFLPLKEQTKKLRELIKTEAWKILEEVHSLNSGASGISEIYFDAAAEMIANKFKVERVFVAPERWSPVILM